MSSRQHAGFDPDWTDLVELPPVRPYAFLEHLVAEDSFLQRVIHPFDGLQRVFIRFRKKLVHPRNLVLVFGDVRVHIGIRKLAFQVARALQKLGRRSGRKPRRDRIPQQSAVVPFP